MDLVTHAARLYFLDLTSDKYRQFGRDRHQRKLRRRKSVNDNNNNEEIQATETDSANVLARLASADANRSCWICLAAEEDEDNPDDDWIHPCNCKKSMKWAHKMCLNRWVDEKQNGNAFLPVKCPFCLTPYQFEYPEENSIFRPINFCENAILMATNNVPAFVILRFCSSAFEIHHFAPDLLFAQKAVLWCFSELILPVPWTLMLLIDLRVREWEMAIIKATLSDDILVPRQERTIEAIQTLDLGDFIRVRLLPTLAILSGEAIFGDRIDNLPLRALAGGLAFAFARACVRIPYRRNQYQIASSRRVKSMEEPSHSNNAESEPARVPEES